MNKDPISPASGHESPKLICAPRSSPFSDRRKINFARRTDTPKTRVTQFKYQTPVRGVFPIEAFKTTKPPQFPHDFKTDANVAEANDTTLEKAVADSDKAIKLPHRISENEEAAKNDKSTILANLFNLYYNMPSAETHQEIRSGSSSNLDTHSKRVGLNRLSTHVNEVRRSNIFQKLVASNEKVDQPSNSIARNGQDQIQKKIEVSKILGVTPKQASRQNKEEINITTTSCTSSRIRKRDMFEDSDQMKTAVGHVKSQLKKALDLEKSSNTQKRALSSTYYKRKSSQCSDSVCSECRGAVSGVSEFEEAVSEAEDSGKKRVARRLEFASQDLYQGDKESSCEFDFLTPSFFKE